MHSFVYLLSKLSGGGPKEKAALSLCPLNRVQQRAATGSCCRRAVLSTPAAAAAVTTAAAAAAAATAATAAAPVGGPVAVRADKFAVGATRHSVAPRVAAQTQTTCTDTLNPKP